MKRLLSIGIILLFIGLAVADEPEIENITISPEKPVSLSTITFIADINGEDIEEVYMLVEECIEGLCYADYQNESMNPIDNDTWECTATLIHDDTTFIHYWLVIKCNNTWYEFFSKDYIHDIYPVLSLVIPEEGYFYLIGKQMGKSFFGNTVLIGRTTIKIDIGSYSSMGIEKVDFYLNGKLKGTVEEKPFDWLWKTFSFGTYNLEIRAYVSGTNYSFVKTQVIAFIL